MVAMDTPTSTSGPSRSNGAGAGSAPTRGSGKPASPRPRAKAAAKPSVIKAVTKAKPAATGSRKRPGAAASTGRSGGGATTSGRAASGPLADPERAPWRGPQNRALYNRTIQRANERRSLVTRGIAGMLSYPDLVLGVLGKRDPVVRDGRVLSRSVQALVELGDRFAPNPDAAGGAAVAADPWVMRAQLKRSAKLARMPVRTDVHVWGRVVPGPAGAPPIPIRAYRRFGSGLGAGDGGRNPPPAIVYFHGGGWVTGDLDTHDASCRMLAVASRCVVVSVDYRLAPEDPFPAAVEDCVAAYGWIQGQADELGIDRRRVGVMGDSAGGNLAAVVALATRPGGGGSTDGVLPPVAQGLIYPAVDARLGTESVRSMAEGFFLTREGMEQSRLHYLPDRADWEDWRASPLLAEDHRGVAPALVVTAGFDPLRDDGANYAEALRSAGVDVEYRCYDDQVHGFMGMGVLPDSLALAIEVSDAMGRLIRRSSPSARSD